MGPAQVGLRAPARHVRHPAHRRRQGLHDRRGCGRRRRIARLRQHALRTAGPLLPAIRAGRTSRTGSPSWLPTTTRPSGCWVSSTNAARHRRRRGHAGGGRRRWGSEDTFRPTPVGVFFGGPGQAPGEEVRRPVLRRCRAAAAHLHRLRLVHDRVPAQREEHPGEELPPPRRAGRRHRPPADDRDPGPAAREGGYEVDARWTKAKLSRKTATKTFTADHVVFSAAALGTQKLLHP